MATASVCVIGAGNELRGDDAAGLTVARRLHARCGDGVRVIESDGDGAALIDAWQGYATAVLIDAVQSRATPGTFFCSARRHGAYLRVWLAMS